MLMEQKVRDHTKYKTPVIAGPESFAVRATHDDGEDSG